MTSKWIKEETSQPRERHCLSVGPVDVVLSVDDKTGKTWKWFYLSFGRFDERTIKDCREDWAREAIASARAYLDKFEAELNEGT